MQIPPDVRLLCREVLPLLDGELYDRAVPKLRRIVARLPDAPEPRQMLAAALRSCDQHGAAIEVAQALVARFPTYAGGHYELAIATVCLPSPLDEPAFALAMEAIRFAPDVALYYVPAAMACSSRDRHDDTIQWADRGLALDPANMPLRHLRSVALASVGRVAEAITMTELYVAEAPYDYSVRGYAGWVYLRAGRAVEAVEHFRTSLAIRARRPFALEGLATALIELGEHDEARRHAEQLLGMSPASNEARSLLARLSPTSK